MVIPFPHHTAAQMHHAVDVHNSVTSLASHTIDVSDVTHTTMPQIAGAHFVDPIAIHHSGPFLHINQSQLSVHDVLPSSVHTMPYPTIPSTVPTHVQPLHVSTHTSNGNIGVYGSGNSHGGTGTINGSYTNGHNTFTGSETITTGTGPTTSIGYDYHNGNLAAGVSYGHGSSGNSYGGTISYSFP